MRPELWALGRGTAVPLAVLQVQCGRQTPSEACLRGAGQSAPGGGGPRECGSSRDGEGVHWVLFCDRLISWYTACLWPTLVTLGPPRRPSWMARKSSLMSHLMREPWWSDLAPSPWLRAPSPSSHPSNPGDPQNSQAGLEQG